MSILAVSELVPVPRKFISFTTKVNKDKTFLYIVHIVSLYYSSSKLNELFKQKLHKIDIPCW